jgi:Ca2+-binding EF-hand superfamily protein
MRVRPGPRLARATFCALAALPLACATTQGAPPATEATGTEAHPEPESIWAFVASKYDGDGDGQVAAAEYDRGQVTFERLDRDGDGALTTSDFESATRGPPMTLTRADSASMTVWRVFRREQDMDLSRDELLETLAELDEDGDERLTWKEIKSALPRGGPGSGDNRFGLLTEVIDEDGDGALARGELLAFFDRRDSDGDAVLSMLGGGNRAPRDVGPPIGARPGDTAPDFTLPSADGESDVTLSGFRGDTPVALIFGSYT